MPPPPPSHPSPSPPPPTASEVAAQLNRRFRDAADWRTLTSAGVLVSQFDELCDEDRPWHLTRNPQYAELADRRSAVLVYSGMRPDARQRMRDIPLYSNFYGNKGYGAGFVLRAAAFNANLLCAYTGDGASFTIRCTAGQVAPQCIPGCQPQVAPECNWCMDVSHEGIPCTNWGRCAYRSSELSNMVENYPRTGGYNELILSSAPMDVDPAAAIEAFFYLNTPQCEVAAVCKGRALRAQRAFAQEFPARGNAPLLSLDVTNWVNPFAAASDPDEV